MELNQSAEDKNCIIANGKPLKPFVGMDVLNFLDKSVYRYVNMKRKAGTANILMQHETVTVSWENTYKVLQPKSINPRGRGLGVHFIVEHNGKIYQHGDVETDLMYHANPHNGKSVGVELVNPYYPEYIPKTNSPWTEVVNDLRWADKKRYTVPTLVQLEANFQLQEWLLSSHSGMKIPKAYPGVKNGKMSMNRIAGISDPGVWAHTYFAHADGAFLVLYNWLRSETGMHPEWAYHEAVELIKKNKGLTLDLTPFIQNRPK